MKITLLIILLSISGVTLSDVNLWKPDPKFQLEYADYMQTMSWISGVSYTLTKLQTEKIFLCDGPDSIGSNEIIDYLNAEYSGEQISSEQAIEAIFRKLNSLYPCHDK